MIRFVALSLSLFAALLAWRLVASASADQERRDRAIAYRRWDAWERERR